jgi:transcription-repair coupling factor (superfamily II helicase)
VRKIEMGPQGGRVLFDERPNVDPMAVIRLIQSKPKELKLDGGDRLRVTVRTDDAGARIGYVDRLLDQLAEGG